MNKGKGKQRVARPRPIPKPRTLGAHIRAYPHLYNAHLVRGMLVSLRELVAIDRARTPPAPLPPPSASLALEIAVTRAVHLGYQAYLSSSAAEAHAPPPSARLSAAEFAEVLELTVRLAYERFEEAAPPGRGTGEGAVVERVEKTRPAPTQPPTLDVEIPQGAALLDDDGRALRYLADGSCAPTTSTTTVLADNDDTGAPFCSCFHDRG
ncbi:uncharacterized protein LOC62_02G003388 [Vanrija pseudolonga]|uniref:Uncharacterized protein n=1 Tax=Vanrija pseudolonga TaxID=143232 RepID=A0AAF1BJH7_9TREE|nr:hypothetical protein LOC62_02G003388 [Vanrija pseudolonga]